jgi:hypothetical protein
LDDKGEVYFIVTVIGVLGDYSLSKSLLLPPLFSGYEETLILSNSLNVPRDTGERISFVSVCFLWFAIFSSDLKDFK